MATVILSSFNLSNLIASNTYIKLLSFNYAGYIEPFGQKAEFCKDQSYLKFAWLSGFFTISTAVFLLFSFMTAFVFTLISCGTNSSVLYCHVVLTGKIPSGIFFIAILSLLQSILSAICFLEICCHRAQIATELKYGIDPVPDPWSLDDVVKNKTVIVEGENNFEEMTKIENISSMIKGDQHSKNLEQMYNQNQLSNCSPKWPHVTFSNVLISNDSKCYALSAIPIYGGIGNHKNTLSKQQRIVLNAIHTKVEKIVSGVKTLKNELELLINDAPFSMYSVFIYDVVMALFRFKKERKKSASSPRSKNDNQPSSTKTNSKTLPKLFGKKLDCPFKASKMAHRQKGAEKNAQTKRAQQ
ncbi:hypothetical protein HELRODRAFT_176113 [Helobdella robusta]|uniref:Uncharacterized protein n=1 Tax=Helobdella robusta TaxID=6412 RepID=T1FA55_HELRO|nr:hypothetical protein HELRODRAFT_176113 [Helobdella robusta]ESO00255.1 hypothetical protein HELRODRAFT_176113 [Helobdella robusta]